MLLECAAGSDSGAPRPPARASTPAPPPKPPPPSPPQAPARACAQAPDQTPARRCSLDPAAGCQSRPTVLRRPVCEGPAHEHAAGQHHPDLARCERRQGPGGSGQQLRKNMPAATRCLGRARPCLGGRQRGSRRETGARQVAPAHVPALRPGGGPRDQQVSSQHLHRQSGGGGCCLRCMVKLRFIS